jgi:hypothetical protein
MEGCVPKVTGDHNATTMAQLEVAAGMIGRTDAVEVPATNTVA